MAENYVCLICYHEIPHAGAECPHCKSRISSTVGSTPQMLLAIFGAMLLLFILTGFYNSAFRAEQRARAEEHARIARTLADYGYYKLAIEHYREALTFSRDNLEYQLGLALALYDLERYKEAENRLLDLREGHPTLAVVNRLLARISAREGRLDEAVTYYRTAIFGQWPRNAEENRLATRLELARLLTSRGENMRAVGELLDLLKEEPGRPDVQKTVGRLFLQAGAPDNAAAVYQDLIRRQPSDADVLLGYGLAEFELGNYTIAESTLTRAQRLRPDDAELQNQLDLTRDVNRLDPSRRGISLASRHRRSVELVVRALNLVDDCVNPRESQATGPAPPAPREMQPMLAKARELRHTRRQAATDENIETNISMAEQLWQVRQRLCPKSPAQDSALQHVLQKLSR